MMMNLVGLFVIYTNEHKEDYNELNWLVVIFYHNATKKTTLKDDDKLGWFVVVVLCSNAIKQKDNDKPNCLIIIFYGIYII
jgi:hypothetical protein